MNHLQTCPADKHLILKTETECRHCAEDQFFDTHPRLILVGCHRNIFTEQYKEALSLRPHADDLELWNKCLTMLETAIKESNKSLTARIMACSSIRMGLDAFMRKATKLEYSGEESKEFKTLYNITNTRETLFAFAQIYHLTQYPRHLPFLITEYQPYDTLSIPSHIR